MERYYSKVNLPQDIQAEINRLEAKLREYKRGLLPLGLLTAIVWIICGVVGLLSNAGFTVLLIFITIACFGGRIGLAQLKQQKIDRLYNEYEKDK